jgi:hypothetical protein
LYKEIVDFIPKYRVTPWWVIRANMRRIRRMNNVKIREIKKLNVLSESVASTMDKLTIHTKPDLETCIKFCYVMRTDLPELVNNIDLDTLTKLYKSIPESVHKYAKMGDFTQ